MAPGNAGGHRVNKQPPIGGFFFIRPGEGQPRAVLKPLLFLTLLALSPAALGEDVRYKPVRSLLEFRTEGVVMQQWDNSCAAAALATALTYGFSDPLSERDVAKGMLGRADAVKVKVQGGFSFLDMKRFVEARGYKGVGFRKMRIEDLRKYQSPIVPIEVHGYPHFVVFKGVSGDQVLLADPAFGNRTMPIERFEQAWTDGLAFVVLRNLQ